MSSEKATTSPHEAAGSVRHPIFARFFDRLSRWMEPAVGRERDRLVAELSGRVLEVGAGNGVNFARYPDSVDEVVALEPEPFLRARAERAAAQAKTLIHVQAGLAAPLPFNSSSFDAAVASLVLCTVPDLREALIELRRVLKPGGELRFFEHVRSRHAAKARIQRGFDASGVWPLIGGGCHCSRSTIDEMAAVGFRIAELEELAVGPAWNISNPHVRGIAYASG